jgi:MazG family protein
MSIGQGFEQLVSLMARLRAPNGCPWDREQSLESLRPFILEEAYELVEAIDRSHPEAIREELGDLLLEVLFVSQICTETAHFTIVDVMKSLEDKLIRRHPHVFRSKEAKDSGEALARWEEIKDSEKPKPTSVLEDVPRAVPALVRAHKLSTRAAREGFDWASADDVLDKLSEEVHELENARRSKDPDVLTEEMGDLLFTMVNLARHLEVDPEMALHAANRKFVERFQHVETKLAGQKRELADASMEEMEELWEEAKRKNSRTQEPKNSE